MAAGQIWRLQVTDVSEAGALIGGAVGLPVGSQGTVEIDGVGFPLPFSVRARDHDSVACRVRIRTPWRLRAGSAGCRPGWRNGGRPGTGPKLARWRGAETPQAVRRRLVVRIKLKRHAIIGDRFVALIELLVNFRPRLEAIGLRGRQCNGFFCVRQARGVLAHQVIRPGAIVVGFGEIWVDRNRLGVIGDRLVAQTLFCIGDGAPVIPVRSSARLQ